MGKVQLSDLFKFAVTWLVSIFDFAVDKDSFIFGHEEVHPRSTFHTTSRLGFEFLNGQALHFPDVARLESVFVKVCNHHDDCANRP